MLGDNFVISVNVCAKSVDFLINLWARLDLCLHKIWFRIHCKFETFNNNTPVPIEIRTCVHS